MNDKWHIYARGRYIGTAVATEAELREVFKYAKFYELGHAVDVWMM